MKSGPERSHLRLSIEWMSEGSQINTHRPNTRREQDNVGSMCRKQAREDGRTYRTHQNAKTGTIWVKCVSEWEDE